MSDEIEANFTVFFMNDEGALVELYIPRKCSSSSRIIAATDHAAVQIDLVDVDPKTGRMVPGKVIRYAICGEIRCMGESDDCIMRLAKRDGLIPSSSLVCFLFVSLKQGAQLFAPGKSGGKTGVNITGIGNLIGRVLLRFRVF
uniref:Small ribosomal subunit protein eS21 n=1 Tax=Wuchereria bancrofti TaxID=6293 RepID=A0A1I8EVJ1_WUCBA